MPSIRNLAICVFRHGTRILVARGTDDVKGEAFLRPLGGAVEFGERIVDALRREIREELGVEIRDPVRLGLLENVFTYRGEPGHEIVFVFDAKFVDPDLYTRTSLPLDEPVWDGEARWIDLAEPQPLALYPEGLLTLLEENP
ncbi:MAG: NUDIX domain-containing protein [Acidobacteriota bacterium]